MLSQYLAAIKHPRAGTIYTCLADEMGEAMRRIIGDKTTEEKK